MKTILTFIFAFLAITVFGQADRDPALARHWVNHSGYGMTLTNVWTEVNVRSYPWKAVGDGVHNDTAAIQAAIDFVVFSNSSPSQIYIPSGKYLINTLNLSTNSTSSSKGGRKAYTIRGDGLRSSMLWYTGTSGNAVQFLRTATVNNGYLNNFYMHDIGIYGPVITAGTTNCDGSQGLFFGFDGNLPYTDTSSWTMQIENVAVVGFGVGICITNTVLTSITDCIVMSNTVNSIRFAHCDTPLIEKCILGFPPSTNQVDTAINLVADFSGGSGRGVAIHQCEIGDSWRALNSTAPVTVLEGNYERIWGSNIFNVVGSVQSTFINLNVLDIGTGTNQEIFHFATGAQGWGVIIGNYNGTERLIGIDDGVFGYQQPRFVGNSSVMPAPVRFNANYFPLLDAAQTTNLFSIGITNYKGNVAGISMNIAATETIPRIRLRPALGSGIAVLTIGQNDATESSAQIYNFSDILAFAAQQYRWNNQANSVTFMDLFPKYLDVHTNVFIEGSLTNGGTVFHSTNSPTWPAAADVGGQSVVINSNGFNFLLHSSIGSTAWSDTNSLDRLWGFISITNDVVLTMPNGTYLIVSNYTTAWNSFGMTADAGAGVGVGSITNDIAGWYRVAFHVSLIGANNVAIEGEIFVNGVPNDYVAFEETMGAAAAIGNASAVGIVYLPAKARTDIRLRNNGGTANITVQRAQLTIERL